MSTSSSPKWASAPALLVVLVGIPALNVHVLQPWLERNADGGRGVWWANSFVLLALHVAAVAMVWVLGSRLERPSRTQALIGLGIVGAAVLSFGARELGLYDSSYTDVFNPTTAPERATFLANGIVIGGLQEPMWRGFAFHQLKRRWTVAVGVAITSISFGYYHGGLSSLGNSAFTGMAAVGLSWLYLRTNTLWWPILVHVGFNVAAGAFA